MVGTALTELRGSSCKLHGSGSRRFSGRESQGGTDVIGIELPLIGNDIVKLTGDLKVSWKEAADQAFNEGVSLFKNDKLFYMGGDLFDLILGMG